MESRRLKEASGSRDASLLHTSSNRSSTTTTVRHGVSGMSHYQYYRRRKGMMMRRSFCSRGAAVRRKLRTLQRLVPGGRRLQQEQLFLLTADYIFQLRLQVHLLRALSNLYLP